MAARSTKPAAGKLSTYKAKRDFSKTGEPSGEGTVAPSARARFVIQKHAATRLHYDFRIELDGVFKSWAVTRGPSLDPADKRLAVEVEDHPLDYGDFEGTIPKGQYGGGTVLMWDRGYWEVEGPRPAQEALAKGDFKFRLFGKRLHGSWVLVRMRRRERDKRDNWLLIKHRDEHAVDGDGEAVLAEDKSVASGRTMAQIAAGKGRAPKPFMLAKETAADAVWHSDRFDGGDAPPKLAPAKYAPLPGRRVTEMPAFVAPQLCNAVDQPPRASGWVHEIKFDGYRMQMRVEDGKGVLRTRKGLDWTKKFSAIARSGARLPDCIIDGEVVAVDRAGVPHFPSLQDALSKGKTDALVYFAFDLLFCDGLDLRGLPLIDRKARLRTLLEGADSRLRFVTHLETDGGAVLEAARKMALEGIVSKRLDAPYRSGRGAMWTKTKTRPGQEVVIGGWSEENGRFRSLLAGVYRNGKLDYLGRVGTGYDRETARLIFPRLKAVAAGKSPFSGANAPEKTPDVRWAEPSLVAEIEIGGWTGSGMVREAAFKGLREDKPAREVKGETVMQAKKAEPRTLRAPLKVLAKPANASVLGVTLSHPDKVLWPAAEGSKPVTKRDLADYYAAVGDWMIEHLKGRPCSVVRAPDGIGGQHFFQRHAGQGTSDLMTLVTVSGDKSPYLQLDSVEALIAAAQISVMELHPWNCQPGDPETPGRLVFDLDPAPDVAFARVIEAAREFQDRLNKLGLESFCKTTGGKGLHVVTPFAREKSKLEWPAAKGFAQEVCRQVAADSPDRYLITMAKKDRVGRIFLDYLRNDRTATAVGPLSPRARPGAPVSMPVTWAQVRPGLDPRRFTVHSAPALLGKSSAWADYHRAGKSFFAAARRLLAK